MVLVNRTVKQRLLAGAFSPLHSCCQSGRVLTQSAVQCFCRSQDAMAALDWLAAFHALWWEEVRPHLTQLWLEAPVTQDVAGASVCAVCGHRHKVDDILAA